MEAGARDQAGDEGHPRARGLANPDLFRLPPDDEDQSGQARQLLLTPHEGRNRFISEVRMGFQDDSEPIPGFGWNMEIRVLTTSQFSSDLKMLPNIGFIEFWPRRI